MKLWTRRQRGPIRATEGVAVRSHLPTTILFTYISTTHGLLHGPLTSPNFRELHAHLLALARQRTPRLEYVYRPIPQGVKEDRTNLSGYGVTLDVKKTDYLVLDDRLGDNKASSEDGSSQSSDEAAPHVDLVLQALEAYPVLNESIKLTDPLTETELQQLGIQATHLISSFPNPLATFKQLSQDFPHYASALARRVPIPQELTDELSANALRTHAGVAHVWLNGGVVPQEKMNPFRYNTARRATLVANRAKRNGPLAFATLAAPYSFHNVEVSSVYQAVKKDGAHRSQKRAKIEEVAPDLNSDSDLASDDEDDFLGPIAVHINTICFDIHATIPPGQQQPFTGPRLHHNYARFCSDPSASITWTYNPTYVRDCFSSRPPPVLPPGTELAGGTVAQAAGAESTEPSTIDSATPSTPGNVRSQSRSLFGAKRPDGPNRASAPIHLTPAPSPAPKSKVAPKSASKPKVPTETKAITPPTMESVSGSVAASKAEKKRERTWPIPKDGKLDHVLGRAWQAKPADPAGPKKSKARFLTYKADHFTAETEQAEFDRIKYSDIVGSRRTPRRPRLERHSAVVPIFAALGPGVLQPSVFGSGGRYQQHGWVY
ncbi:hypothetical protein PENSPDRAFT_695308 [Peniophora sp. CONT]|nr:hypothetical protein PENSPDRAFT_695308 [Peniophora sp. CONT]